MRRLPCAAADETIATANAAPSQTFRAFTVESPLCRAVLFGARRRDAGFDRVTVERPMRVLPRRHELHVMEQPLAPDAFKPCELIERIGVGVDPQVHRRGFPGGPH